MIRIAGLAAAGIAVAGAAVAVTASAAGYSFNVGGAPSSNLASTASLTGAGPQDKSGTASAVCSDFMTHFAADLGSDQTKVNAAFQKAISETLADQVKAGKITQAQADKIKAALAGKEPCAIGPAISGHGKAAIGAYREQVMVAAASALGITPDQLKADFAKGMSLSQIAAAHNPPITESQFRTAFIANIKPLLDKAVTDGKLTPAQEQKILQRLQTGPIPFWNKAPKSHSA